MRKNNVNPFELKQKIFETMEIALDSQKLIYYGKVLNDESKKMSEYGIKENDFIVLMITKVHFSLFLETCSKTSPRAS